MLVSFLVLDGLVCGLRHVLIPPDLVRLLYSFLGRDNFDMQ